MATVDGKTSIKIDELLEGFITNGYISVAGHLMLVKGSGAEIDAGVIDSKRNENWLYNAPYVSGDIVSFAGRTYRATLANTNKCPAFYSSYWRFVQGSDSEDWHEVDPDFNADYLSDNYSTFWSTNSPTISMTTVPGEFETGVRAVKADLPISASQRIIPKHDNLVRGGETFEISIRARLSSLVAGATIDADIIQNTPDNEPEPFATGSAYATSLNSPQELTTSWAWYRFRFTALGYKPRARPHILIAAPGSSPATFFIDRWHVRRTEVPTSFMDQVMDKMYPIGSVWMTEETDDPNDLFYGTWVRYAEGTTLVGQKAADADFDTGGETGGSKTKTLTVGNLPPHQHSMTHTHPMERKTGVASGSGVARGDATSTTSYDTGAASSSETGTGSAQGLSSTPLDVMNPYTVVYIWKRTA